MLLAAEKNNVLLMEAVKSTLAPNFFAIQENLHKLGKIRRYVASNCQYSSRYDAYKEGTILRAFDPNFANGTWKVIDRKSAKKECCMSGGVASVHNQRTACT